MTIRTSPNMNFSPGDDATFRATIKEISDSIQAMGMVKTTDTGQINFTTVARATGQNQSQGYEIFRFDDALQATKPVFFKVEYGEGDTGNANQLSIWLTVGSGSNGAGTITGITTPRQQFVGPWNGGNNAFQGISYWSGDSSGFVAVIGDFGSQPWMVWNFERTRNPTDGTSVGEGVLFYVYTGAAYSFGNTHSWLFYPTNGRTNAGNWYRGTNGETPFPARPSCRTGSPPGSSAPMSTCGRSSVRTRASTRTGRSTPTPSRT